MTHVYQLINVWSSLDIDECTITMIKIAFVKNNNNGTADDWQIHNSSYNSSFKKINIVNNTSH